MVSSSDEGVWALQLVVTTSEGVMSDSENIVRTLKGFVRPEVGIVRASVRRWKKREGKKQRNFLM